MYYIRSTQQFCSTISKCIQIRVQRLNTGILTAFQTLGKLYIKHTIQILAHLKTLFPIYKSDTLRCKICSTKQTI